MQLNITKDKENEAVSFETASFFFCSIGVQLTEPYRSSGIRQKK